MPVASAGCREGTEGSPMVQKSPPKAGFLDGGKGAGAGNALLTPEKAAAPWAAAFALSVRMRNYSAFSTASVR